jgi:hypothetical protein
MEVEMERLAKNWHVGDSECILLQNVVESLRFRRF